MTRKPQPSALAGFVRQALTAHELTISELAHRLGYAGNSFVSGILLGTKTLPPEATEAWAEAMQLNTFERQRWISLCARELAPAVVREYLHRLEREVAAKDKRIAELESAIVEHAVARAKRRG